MTYDYTSTPINKVRLDLRVSRKDNEHNSKLGDFYYRTIDFSMTLPVSGNWICGINGHQGGTGMYFVADKHYEGMGEFKMDTVHCYFNNREAWIARGGKFHEPQTYKIEFPNGDNWT
jgi:hypothetical protein